jgi:cell filamentation protein
MVTDKYGTGSDPYCYRDSYVLRNVLNIEHNADLEKAEQDFSTLAAAQIEFNPPPYDLNYLKNIHKLLFEDLYEWAGDLRFIDMSKGKTRFCTFNRITAEANKLFRALKHADYYIYGHRAGLVSDITELYIELNMVHPFREGNGRAQRILFEHIIINCGFEFDLKGIAQRNWVDANVAGVHGNYAPMTQIFEHCIGGKFVE